MRTLLTPLLAGWALLLVGCTQPATNDNAPILWVADEADMLSDAAEARITEKLIALEKETSDQLLVWTVPSLEGRWIEDVSLERARSLGIGTAELDNGVMITLAKEERRVRIEVGTGLEALLTDLKAAHIIRDDMTPRFRDGDFDGGVEAGVSAISDVLLSDRERPQYRSEIREKMAS